MSPRPGGESDKFGQRYEGAWTVRQVLRVLYGEAESITLEDTGDLGEGSEFTIRHADGRVEVHQVKRQHRNVNHWSVASLRDNGVLHHARRHVEAGREFHFVSVLPARPLQELAERARRARDLGAFGQDWLTGELTDPFTDLCAPEVYGSASVAFRVLRGLHIAWHDEPQLRSTNAALAGVLLGGGRGSTAAACLAELALDSTGESLSAHVIRHRLHRYGLRPADCDDGRSAKVGSLTASWAENVSRGLIQPTISRTEADDLLTVLTQEQRLALLTGAAGSGKSAVLHQAVRALLDSGTPVLAIRLDRWDPFRTTEGLGEQLGLGSLSPVSALASVAAGRACVLVVDQLDAVSKMSGRMPESFEATAELAQEARAFPTMRVVFACRSFDVDNDHRLRSLDDGKRSTRVKVEALSDAQVDAALAAIGVESTGLSRHQRQLLCSPLNLSLFQNIAVGGGTAPVFQTERHLLDAFWLRKLTDCRRRREGIAFGRITATLAEAMSARRRLSVPASVLDTDDLLDQAELLVSEHVLVRDGEKLAFFHEAFFDYVFARGWQQRGESLNEFLLGGEQELFRRAQVRQIMQHLRSDDSDRFIDEVEALLLDPDIRYHLKDVALALLSDLSEPTTAEWDMLSRVLDSRPDLEERIWRGFETEGWFCRLDEEGVIEDAAASPDPLLRRRVTGLLRTGAHEHPDRLAAILAAHQDAPEFGEWLHWVMRFAELHRSRPLFDLLLAAVRTDRYGSAGERLWLDTGTFGKVAPDWSVELLLAHLAARPSALALDSRGRVSALNSREHSLTILVGLAASGAPVLFAEQVLPYLLTVMATTAYAGDCPGLVPDRHFGWRHPQTRTRPDQLDDALLAGSVSALHACTTLDPDRAQPLLEELASSRFDAAQWILYQVLSDKGELYADWAAGLLLEGDSRFLSGYVSNGVWASRQLIEGIGPHLTPEILRQLEAAILALRFPWEGRRPGWYTFNLLSALPEHRLGDQGRRRLRELRRLAGAEQPEPPAGITAGLIGAPIPVESAARMSDDQWMGAISKHADEVRNWQTLTGGAPEQATVLRSMTTQDPARFSRLALRLTTAHHPAYGGAVLLGMSEAEAIDDAEQAFAAVRHIASLGHTEHDRWLGHALRRYRHLVPLDLVALLAERALSSADPVDDTPVIRRLDHSGEEHRVEALYSTAINSGRGCAADALADLVAQDADGSRTALVTPLLSRMARDPSLAVRCSVARVIHAATRHTRPAAVAAFTELMDGGDLLLGAPTVLRLMIHLGDSSPELVRPTIWRMITSREGEVRRAGGLLAARAAAFWEMPDLLDAVLTAGGTACRVGAADACAQLLVAVPKDLVIRGAAAQLLSDPEEPVREAMAALAAALRGQRLRAFTPALELLIESPAFSPAVPQLLITLEHAPDRVDGLVLACAHRFIALHGADAQDARTRFAADVHQVDELLLRAYAQAGTPARRSAVLDLVDRLLELGVSRLSELIERSGR